MRKFIVATSFVLAAPFIIVLFIILKDNLLGEECSYVPICSTTLDSQSSFAKRMHEISKDLAVPLSHETNLLKNENFVSIYNSPECYLGDAIHFIGNDSSPTSRYVAIRIMDKLESDAFMYFFENTSDLLIKGKLSENEFEKIIFRYFNDSSDVFKIGDRDCMPNVISKLIFRSELSFKFKFVLLLTRLGLW